MKLNKRFNIVVFAILLMVILAFSYNSLSAAGITNLSDKMSRMAPSVLSDHTFTFTSAAGLQNSGEYYRIRFKTGDFAFGTVDFSDIDLTWGPTGTENSEILNSIPTTTAYGVTVGADYFDLIHPTNNANGDIFPNSVIIVKIGLNASGGDAQITNPATLGSRAIDISSSTGERGGLAVVIANDLMDVSATTYAITLDPPTNITENSMDLSWSAYASPDFVSYQVYFSTSPNVDNTDTLFTTILNSATTNTTVTGISDSTNYYLVVYVTRSGGAVDLISNEVSATTESGGGVVFLPPADPSIDSQICPYFWSPAYLSGGMEIGSIVSINGTFEGVEYPSTLTWKALRDLVLYDNNDDVSVYARKNNLNSNVVTAAMLYWRIGDTQGNVNVDDFDLSNVASHWNTDWCYADFYDNDFVDDFDLSGLAWNWDSIY